MKCNKQRKFPEFQIIIANYHTKLTQSEKYYTMRQNLLRSVAVTRK